MATLPLKRTSPTAVPPRTEPPAARCGGLSWLWLLADRAMIGAAKAHDRAASQAPPRPDADVERSWALADLALEQSDESM